jgi:poly(ADP-ribose) glycohydrolase ARH3
MTSMTIATKPLTRDRARGLLLGLALGDALGAPLEGRDSVDPADLVAEELAPSGLVHTDDTALALVLAAHLADHRDTTVLDEDLLAREFASAWRAEPWRGYGSGTPKVFGLINAGVPWPDATRAFHQGLGSFGNGAAMRVAPVALAGTSLRHTAELARRSAIVTHAHKHGQHGAVCQAAAAYLALRSDPASPLAVPAFLQDLARVVHSGPWQEKFDRVAELARRRPEPHHAASALGNDASALGSVPTALLAFLLHPDRPNDAIRYAIRVGGDTDTIAAMAGALAGARTGASALPVGWLRRLPVAGQLQHLADRLS